MMDIITHMGNTFWLLNFILIKFTHTHAISMTGRTVRNIKWITTSSLQLDYVMVVGKRGDRIFKYP